MSTHILRIKHDAESHEIENCHDDCEADVICPGVTDTCRAWWECGDCLKASRNLSGEALENFDEQLYDQGEAHGKDHQRIDGMWMTPTTECISSAMKHNGGDFIDQLPDGDHPCDLDCEEGFVYVIPIKTAAPPDENPATTEGDRA